MTTIWLTTKQAAEYVKHSPAEVRRMANNKQIPAHRPKDKPKGHYRFDQAELDQWLRQGARPVRHVLTSGK